MFLWAKSFCLVSDLVVEALAPQDWTHIHFHTLHGPHHCWVSAASKVGLKLPILSLLPSLPSFLILLHSVEPGLPGGWGRGWAVQLLQNWPAPILMTLSSHCQSEELRKIEEE